ncbi:MAG: hypothetical protein AB8G23_05455 [Myxococcota bacterium]
MWIRFAPASLVGVSLWFVAAVATAQTQPFSFSVESFSIPERGVFDDFNDGVIDPAWDGLVIGTVVESGSSLTISNPGGFGFLPAPLVNEASGVSGQGVALDFAGDLTATSIWTQQTPDLSTGFSLALGSFNSSTTNIHQVSVGLGDTVPAMGTVLGAVPGSG